MPGAGGMPWPGYGVSLHSGGVNASHREWSRRFGQLPPGRYMYIIDGWLGDWSPDQDTVFLVVEFYVTEDCPVELPPRPHGEFERVIRLVEYRDITPGGMTIVVENSSQYDIDHRAHIRLLVEERHADDSTNWWPWRPYQLPFLPVEGTNVAYLIQGQGVLPGGGQLEFRLDWSGIFGELEPGEYRIVLDLNGFASPPHGIGWVYGEESIIFFKVGF